MWWSLNNQTLFVDMKEDSHWIIVCIVTNGHSILSDLVCVNGDVRLCRSDGTAVINLLVCYGQAWVIWFSRER